MSTIPESPEGYAIDLVGGIVHRRWAGHALGMPRTRRPSGIWAHLGNRMPTPCEVCFPSEDAIPEVPIITADDLDAPGASFIAPQPRRRRAEVPVIEVTELEDADVASSQELATEEPGP